MGSISNPREESSARACAYSLLLVQDSAARRFTTEKNVMGNVEVRAEVELLVDKRDSSVAGLPGAGEAHGSALEGDCALIRRNDASEDLHQRAFARSVFTHQNVDFPPA